MTPLTAEKVRLTMLAIEALRVTGKIDPTEPVSTGRMARISDDLGCPVSEKTFRIAVRDHVAIARLALHALTTAPVSSPMTNDR